jgi:hypothetical protein
MRRAGRGLWRAAAVSLVVVAVCSVDTSIAAPPNVTIASPLNGSVSNNQTPSFNGLADEAGGEVTLRIYNGPNAEGTAIQELSTLLLFAGEWALGPTEPLGDGTYTAQATQTNLALETGVSLPVTFTVDTSAPTVTLNQPESPTSNSMPSFTGTASDTTPVIIHIHTGATPKGTVVSMATATGTGAHWASGNATPSLPSGQYTAVATQASSLPGNPAGKSEPVTFTVIPPPIITPAAIAPPAPPTASFKWFPLVPRTREPVSLVSTSTDVAGPVTGFAWDLMSAGTFQSGGAVLTTSFPTPGDHVVRLRVNNVYGLSSVATATIKVVRRKALLMRPFPVVRIVGTDTASGVKLRLLKVQQMPAAARITVRCKGRGCPVKSVKRLAVSRKQGVAPVEFRQFERSLHFGVTLEILISKPGEIGKYTRFAIRHGKLPERVDMCLDQMGVKPLRCPSS